MYNKKNEKAVLHAARLLDRVTKQINASHYGTIVTDESSICKTKLRRDVIDAPKHINRRLSPQLGTPKAAVHSIKVVLVCAPNRRKLEICIESKSR